MGGADIKKYAKITLIVLLIIVAIVVFLAVFFRSYINAFIVSQTKSLEELEQLLADKNKSTQVALGKYPEIKIRDLTEEEQRKLANNEISDDQAMDLILGLATLPEEDNPKNEDDIKPTKPVDNKVDTVETQDDLPPLNPEVSLPSDPSNEELAQTNAKVARLVAKLYVAKSKATSNLKSLENKTRNEYYAIPEAERAAAHRELLSKVLKTVASWETECDAEVNSILSEIEKLLKESGQNLSLVNSIRAAYQDEKVYTKAYYVNRYM